MRALGAKVILTPAAERGTGMVRLAAALADKHGWFLARQFQNPANPAFHRQTTGPEILKDFAARRLDYWVTGWGTGGTLTGAGEMIKLARPDVKIIATEPAGASLLGGKEWAPHKIQGWTPDFLPDVLNPKVFDQLLPVTDEEGKSMARRLAREEGIFVGISAGATLAATLKAAERAAPGSVLLAMLPDTGERYLGTYLFDDLNAGSDDVWLASLDEK
jgi:cysteine synthase A